MGDYYNRYSKFTKDSQVSARVPFVEIDTARSDLFITFDKSRMRADLLSYKYYGDPQYGWLILQANPSYGGFEFSIPDGVTYRIPYPIESALGRYEDAVNKWQAEHGI